MWRHRRDYERAIPSRVELPRKELKFGIEKPYLLFWIKRLRQNMSVMKCLYLFLVNVGTVIASLCNSSNFVN
jgi:hypothetical protein